MKLAKKLARRLTASGGYFGHGIADPASAPEVSPDRITHVHPDDFEMFLRDGPQDAEISFDDGYADNLTTALPLLERYDRTATVFITIGFVDRSRPLLARVAAAVARSGDWQQPSVAELVPETANTPHDVYQHLREALKSLGSTALWQQQQRILADYALSLDDLTNDYLSLDELMELDRHPLITVGAHTISHPDLRSCSHQELDQELGEARGKLEKWLDHPVLSLAYPFGDTNGRVRQHAARAGYSRAYVTETATWRSRLPGFSALDITRIDLSGEARRLHRRRRKAQARTGECSPEQAKTRV